MTFEFLAPDEVRLKTYGDLAREYGDRPEVSAAAPDGLPCHSTTIGRLDRLRIQVPGKDWIGKEANSLELLDAGLVTSPEEICQAIDTSERVPEWVIQAMHRHPAREIASAVGISERYVKAIRNRTKDPSREVAERLVTWAARASDPEERSS